MLLPMYFLIGIWGGPRREYAAIKFFLFTLVGSVLLLVAMLMLYFYSDVHKLSPEQLAACSIVPQRADAATIHNLPQHTFNLLALAEMGQSAQSPFRGHFSGQDDLVVGVPAAAGGLYHQAARGAVPHLAARRPRRDAHADLDDPGRACC